MAYKDNVTQYGFGQVGSGYLSDTGVDFSPPGELAVIAMTLIEDCKFTTLTPDASGITKGDGSEGVIYFGGHGQLIMNGTNSDAVDAAHTFPKGITIYGLSLIHI